jgi:hypothetical protein
MMLCIQLKVSYVPIERRNANLRLAETCWTLPVDSCCEIPIAQTAVRGWKGLLSPGMHTVPRRACQHRANGHYLQLFRPLIQQVRLQKPCVANAGRPRRTRLMAGSGHEAYESQEVQPYGSAHPARTRQNPEVCPQYPYIAPVAPIVSACHGLIHRLVLLRTAARTEPRCGARL